MQSPSPRRAWPAQFPSCSLLFLFPFSPRKTGRRGRRPALCPAPLKRTVQGTIHARPATCLSGPPARLARRAISAHAGACASRSRSLPPAPLLRSCLSCRHPQLRCAVYTRLAYRPVQTARQPRSLCDHSQRVRFTRALLRLRVSLA